MSTKIQQPTWTTDLPAPRWLWLLLLLLPILLIAVFLGYKSLQTLPRIALAPAYALIDQDGNTLTNETLRGNLVIYSFLDTRCTENRTENCTDPSHTLQQLQAEIGDFEINDIPLRFVTVALDPTHDTPEMLRATAKQMGAATAHWHFVSSDPEQFSNLLQAELQNKSVSPEAVPGAPRFVLVDGWGIVRAIYPTAMPDIEQIKRDLHLVAQEARQSSGINRYGYEAVHLFMCHNGL